MKKITIFCSSYNEIEKKYFNDTAAITKILVENNYKIIYGGGANGLMGEIATIATSLKGEIEGIRHTDLLINKTEPTFPNILIRENVKSIEERKQIMYDEADIILVLPGGAGTMEELFFSITNNRLQGKNKPIIIFNKYGFYNSLLKLNDKLICENFIKQSYLFEIAETSDIIKYL